MNQNKCEACKFQNKQCINDCIFAQVFPSDDAYKFNVCNAVFGIETLTLILQDLSPMERICTTRTIFSEAESWFFDSPSKRSGLLTALLNYANQTPEELSETKKLLAYHSRPVVLALPAPRMIIDSSDESDNSGG